MRVRGFWRLPNVFTLPLLLLNHDRLAEWNKTKGEIGRLPSTSSSPTCLRRRRDDFDRTHARGPRPPAPVYSLGSR